MERYSHGMNLMHPCSDHSNDGERAPRADCDQCWRFYNWRQDLPHGNRTPKSRFRADMRLSRRVPDMVSLYEYADQPGTGSLQRLRESIAHISKKEGVRFVPYAIGFDPAIRNTGYAVIGKIIEGDHRRWACATLNKHIELPQDADHDAQTQRQYMFVKHAVKVWRAVGAKQRLPLRIEDHAYSRSWTNNASLIKELHGALKIQLYIAVSAAVQPVGIWQARKIVFSSGRKIDDPQGAMRDALADSGGHFWAGDVTEHELDAWTVACTKVQESFEDAVQAEAESLLESRNAHDKQSQVNLEI